MKDDKKAVYRLYALELTHENLRKAESERFSRATTNPAPYILVYSEREAPDGAIVISAETADRLTASDRQWLADCQAAILAENVKKNQAETIQNLSERIEALEEELRRRKTDMKKED